MGFGKTSAAIALLISATVLPGCSDADKRGSDAGDDNNDGDGGWWHECSADSIKCKAGGTEECFAAGTDCDTIIKCGSHYWGCESGKQATCSSYDVAVCCGGADPVFCEIPDMFVGCIAATSDCSTGVECSEDHWAFCPAGMHPNCEANRCDPL